MAVRVWNDAEFGGIPSVAVAAHELKAPLALIRQLTLLLDEVPEEEVPHIQRRILQTSEQTLHLATDLSMTTNLTPTLFPLEPINPLALCQQIACELKSTHLVYGRCIRWPKRTRGRQMALANRVLLGRVLANFLHNAIKYTESTDDIVVNVSSRGEVIRLSVRDFGPMMSLKEYRQLISEMEVRKTIRTRPESSGLGIYIASQFAKAMNGTIGLIRHQDGLTFYVEVPVSRQLSLL